MPGCWGARVSEADRERWDSRYSQGELVMGPELKPFVRQVESLLPRAGRALDIACGEGQLAGWLAQRGLDVTAVDISPVALDKLCRRAETAGWAPRLRAIEADLDEGLPHITPGLALVSCVDFYAPAIMAQARKLLAPGGMLLVQVVLQPPGGDSPHRAAPNEALGFARGLHLHYYREGMIGRRELAQLLAQRPPAALPAFSD
jgi:SAM-dependent methyltransferase